MEDLPTLRHSLFSIALSLNTLNKEMKKTRQIHKDTLRFMKGEARQTVFRPEPKKLTFWEWMRGLLPA